MTYRIVLHKRAIDEIVASADWIAQYSRAAALQWYEGMYAAIETLRENPDRGELIPENVELPIKLHQLLYGRRQQAHRIIYSIRMLDVHIWTVRHCSRDRLKFEDLLGEFAGDE